MAAPEAGDFSPQGSNSDHRRPNLRLQIPPRSLDALEISSSCGKPPLSPSCSAASSKPVARPSFKSRVLVSTTSPTSSPPSRRSSTPRDHSASPRNPSPILPSTTAARRTTSLPVTPKDITVDVVAATIINREEPSVDGAAKLLPPKLERSVSLPLKKSRSRNATHFQNSNQPGGFVLVRPALAARLELQQDHDVIASSNEEAKAASPRGSDRQEIPLEQAVCRICMDELGEGCNTFHLECSCKGELALAHEECTLKWFGLRGNKTCDVCGKDVQNLPVTLLRLSSEQQQQPPPPIHVRHLLPNMMWQDVPVLIIISMLAYFCLLEQLLVQDMGSGALAITLPFACVLGLLSSITASTLVSRKFIWAYAVLQFGLVILFAHVFYRMIQVDAVLSILLSAFAGFGISMGVNGVAIEYASWRRRRPTRDAQNQETELQEP